MSDNIFNLISLVPSIFEGTGKNGDFNWMIKNEDIREGLTLYLYQDGEENIDRGVKTKSSNGTATIRSYAFHDPPRALAIPTGNWLGGYESLDDHVKNKIAKTVGKLYEMLLTGLYCKVIYSCDQHEILGAGKFRINFEVRKYITQEISRVIKHYNSDLVRESSKGISASVVHRRLRTGKEISHSKTELIPSVYSGNGKDGDFYWMIGIRQHYRSLFIFNDNEKDFLSNAKHAGGGSARIRPYQHNENPSNMGFPRCVGIPTGTNKGYEKLSPSVKIFIDRSMDKIADLLVTGRYSRVYYSGNADGSLGTSIFHVGQEVKDYIIERLKETVNRYNSELNSF